MGGDNDIQQAYLGKLFKILTHEANLKIIPSLLFFHLLRMVFPFYVEKVEGCLFTCALSHGFPGDSDW